MQNVILYCIARFFYIRVYCRAGKVPLSTLVRFGIMQRIFGYNRDVPWPVHHSSQVSSWTRIQLDGHPPYPGLGSGQYIQAINGINIGRNVRLASGVKIISANHSLNDFSLHAESKSIVIDDDCWIGANAVILPGVTLAEHVIVGAGAVVSRSISRPNVVVGGVPARIIKDIGPYSGKCLDRVDTPKH